MEKESNSISSRDGVRKWVVAMGLAWTGLVALLLAWALVDMRRDIYKQARMEARGAFNKDVLYRRWAAGHGGVYVPITEDTPPNPNLSHVAERDIETPSGRRLTLVNPAYMTRQVHEIGLEQYGLRGHITSLNPIRYENAPDLWEKGALEAFEKGEEEVSSIAIIDGRAHMRLMRPLVTEQRCLKCHGHQGYEEGDIRGGVSVSVPMAAYWDDAPAHAAPIVVGHALIWLVGIVGLCASGLIVARRLRERSEAEARIAHLNGVLRAIRNVNQLIVQEKDRGALVQKCCDCLVESRSYCSAWIVLCDESAHPVAAVEAHTEEDPLPLAQCLAREEALSAILELLKKEDVKVVPVSTLCTDGSFSGTDQTGLVALVRLEHEGNIYGLLLLALSSDAQSDDEELSLLKEVAGDIGFALHAIEQEKKREQVERERDVLYHDMGERVKELGCMYGVARSIQERPALEDVFRDTVRLIPPGWHYPEITRGRVQFDGEVFVAEPFAETPWVQSSDIAVGGAVRGSIEVYYLEPRPVLDEGPFMAEERQLIDGMAHALGHAIERQEALIALTGERDNLERTEERLRVDLERGQILLKLYAKAPTLTDRELYDYTVEHTVQLANSEVGFLHLISEDQEDILLTAWNGEALEHCAAAYDTHYPVEQAGNWVDCLRTKKPVVYNDFMNSPNQKGLPQGHSPVHRFMSIPVLQDEKVKIIFGVGNKMEPYDDHDVVNLQLVANELHKIILQREAEHELRQHRDNLEALVAARAKELKESEARLRTILETAGEGIYGLDLAGRTVFVNAAATSLTGWPRDAMLDKVQHEVIHHSRPDGSKYPREECHIYAALRDGTAQHESDEVFWRPDGTCFPVEYVVTPILEDDQVRGAVVVFKDIGERKRLERELLESKETAETASRAKSRFLAAMSHELRTPLTAILGFGRLLKDQHFGPLNEKQAQYVERIDQSGTHLLALVNDLLDLTKIDAGATELEWDSFSAGDCIHPVVDAMRPRLDEKRLAVHVSVDSSIERMVKGDFRRCKQILFNFLSNAVKYTPEGGKIQVDVRQNGPEFLRFEVADTGIGVAPEYRKHVFSEFQQVDRARDEHLGGIGLGLALTRRLVELHGGEIGVDSEPGEGSTFWCTLPAGVEQDGQEMTSITEHAVERQALPPSRILVAEDNPDILDIILDLLLMEGHQVEVARNGQEAVNLAPAFKPEVILMDIRMPVMGGLEATRRIRNIPELADVPIIALTASADKEMVKECYDAGCSMHLSKPIDFEAFSAMMQECLSPASEPIHVH